MRVRHNAAWLAFVVALLTVPCSHGALHTWDGGDGGFWLTASNWVGDVVPQAGDELVFPGESHMPTSINDFPAGTTFTSITLQGPTILRGALVGLKEGLKTYGESSIELPLRLNAPQSFAVQGGFLTLLGDIDNGGHDLTLMPDGWSIEVWSTISGTGGLIQDGGLVQLSRANTYSGPTEIRNGELGILDSNGLGSIEQGTVVGMGGQLTLSPGLTVAEPLSLSGTLLVVGNGSTHYTGAIETRDGGVSSWPSVTLQIDGVLSGSNLTVYGEATVILTATNTYEGRTSLREATLLVNGYQPFTTIVLEGNLGGTGRTGPIVGRRRFGTLNPGSNGVGVLSVGDLSLNALNQVVLELNGASPGTYDQLQVYGTVHLDNPALEVRLDHDPAPEESFLVIMNDGADPITGRFLNLPEGAVVDANERQLRISYIGGDGNDVVLTPIHAPPSVILSITSETFGQVRITGAGISNLQYVLQVATNLPPPLLWQPIAGTVAAPDGSYSFIHPRDAGPTVFFRVQTMAP